jgi:surfeit locus 1 family protein
MIKQLFSGRRIWMTLLVLAGAMIMGRLGIWQLDRMAQRQAINDTINTRLAQPATTLAGAPLDLQALDYRRVEARGVYDLSQEIVLRNRALDGAPGVHVLTPLRLAGSDMAVLVDRGWIPLDQAAPEARRAFAPAAGEVAVAGVARLPTTSAGGPQDPPAGPNRERLDAWFRVDIARIARQAGYRLLPVYLEQQPTPGDTALPRRVPTTDLGPGPHLSYAIQWFAFAIILMAGYLAFTYQQLRGSSQ